MINFGKSEECMKFLLRAGINAVVGGVLSVYSIYIFNDFIDELDRDLPFDLPYAIMLYPVFVFILLYLFNLLCNKIKYLRLCLNKSLWSVTLGIFISGLYFVYRAMFPDYSGHSGFLVELAVDIANGMFVISSLTMFILSIILNILHKKIETSDCQSL